MRKLFWLLAALWALPAVAQYSISQLPPATVPLTGAEIFPCTQSGTTKKCLTSSVAAGAGATFLLQSPNAGLPLSRTLVGTANEILLADGGPLGNLVLSTPQPIATTSSPTFSSLILTNPLTVPNGGTGVNTITGLVLGNGISAMSPYAGTSCTNQFPRSLSSSGVATCASLVLTSADFANQGTTTTVLHGNAAGNLSFGAVSLTTDVSNVLPTANGGTSFGTYTLGDTLYSSATNTLAKLAGNTTTTKQFLTQTGTGAVSAAPAWGTIAAGDLPGSFSGFANPSGLITLVAANGAATTATRSDATHALSQAIAPTWSAQHIFSQAFTTSGTAGNYPVFIQSATPALALDATGAAADAKVWELTATNTDLLGRTSNDAGSTTKNWLDVTRAANVVTAVALGNATDKPPITLNGATTIPTPAAASVALTVNGIGTGTTNAMVIGAPNNVGTSFGLQINAGTNSTDAGLTVRNAAATQIDLQVVGNGAILFPQVVTTASAANAFLDNTNSNNLLRSTSSRRYKTDITSLIEDRAAEVISKLRPVRFHSLASADSHTEWFYGLVAEEVAAVEPSLIVKDKEGKPDGVQYDRVQVFMLPEVQKLRREVDSLHTQVHILLGLVMLSFGYTAVRTRKK